MRELDSFANVFDILAESQGYTKKEVSAGIEYYNRKHRLSHPPGRWDNADRFYPDEDSRHIQSTRRPSRAWPLSYNKAARSPKHLGEVYGARNTVNITRICSFIENKDEFYEAVRELQEVTNREKGNKERVKFAELNYDELYTFHLQNIKKELSFLLKRASDRCDFVDKRQDEPARPATRPVTQPKKAEPVVSKKKPFKPMKVAVDAGFKGHREGKSMIAYYPLDDGYLVLEAKAGNNISIASQALLVLSNSLEDTAGDGTKVMDVNNATSTAEEFTHELKAAISKYESSPAASGPSL